MKLWKIWAFLAVFWLAIGALLALMQHGKAGPSNPPFFPTFGTGAPGATAPANQLYFDTAASFKPYVFDYSLALWKPYGNGAGGTSPGGVNGQIQYNNAGAFGGFTLSGDCTVIVPAISCPNFNSTTHGLVPLSGGGTVNFLRADGTWAAPPTSPPGGSNGNIQFNSAGVFGGLTDVQVTARIQAFSSTLSGAAPASGGGSVNFLRADGTWQPAATTSSVAAIAYHPGFQTGRYYTTPNTIYGGQGLTVNTLYALPFFVPSTTTFTKASVHVQTNVAASHAEMGIYTNVSGVPVTREYDMGQVSTAAAGRQEITGLSLVLTPGWHFLVVAEDSGGVNLLATVNGGGVQDWFLGNSGNTTGVTAITGTWTYSTGNLPTPFPTVGYPTGGNGPLVFLRL